MTTRRILHVEDDSDHAFLVRRCVERLENRCELTHLVDGEKAIAYLSDMRMPLPDLILLDLRLPRVDGFGVLKWVKSDARARHVPVVFLTTSASIGDREGAAQRHVNSYLVKPTELSALRDLISKIDSYWLGLDQLARHGPQ